MKKTATYKLGRFLVSWLNLQRFAVQTVHKVFVRKITKRIDGFEILLQQQ